MIRKGSKRRMNRREINVEQRMMKVVGRTNH